ncbi:MAG: hypothetical protein PHU71_05790 [Candidatus Gracilibacteria bacterium]|nr:hypothetical protein [Candidatus Gracilibacteria bacterium]
MFHKLKKTLLDLFFPLRCVACKKEGAWICKNCLNRLSLRQIQTCPICKSRPRDFGEVCDFCHGKSNLNGIFVVAESHQQVLRQLIHKFKYNFCQEVSINLAELILRNFSQHFLSTENLILIPVPLHPKRERWRGFNQSALLSSLLGSYSNMLTLKNVLLRTRHTKSQMKLKRQQRLRNLEDAFLVHGQLDSKSTYILLDDIVTTGATLEACAKALRAAGARQVWGLALSRGT